MGQVQLPKYIQVVEWVKKQIATGKLNPGEKIYSENELSTMFNMSRQTIRHAIGQLEEEGIIERRQGSGTFVADGGIRNTNKKKTMNIAVVTTYVDDYIFPGIIKGMEKVISDAGYTLQIAFTRNSVEKEYTVIKNILDRGLADGIIVEPTKSGIPNPNIELYEEIMAQGIPIIFFNSYYPELDLPRVVLDDKNAGYEAARYLIKSGCRHIGGVFKSDDRQGHLRYAGYVKALSKYGLTLKDENVLWIDTEDLKNLTMEPRRILKRLEGCDGCVCYNDQAAAAIEKICIAENIQIPSDLSLISIDNSEMAQNCEVPLTSIAHPLKKLGKKAAENLLSLIEGGNPKEATFEFVPEIIERKSTKKRI